MKKFIVKRLTILIILLQLFLLRTQYTDADIFAERTIVDNKFSAMTLDFFSQNSFNSNRIDNLFYINNLEPGGFEIKSFRLNSFSSYKFKYRLQTIIKDSNLLCNNLKIKVLDRNLNSIYSGDLKDLSFNYDLEPDRLQSIIMIIKLDSKDEALQNLSCNFSFDIKTYRENPTEEGGLFAQRIINNLITSSNW